MKLLLLVFLLVVSHVVNVLTTECENNDSDYTTIYCKRDQSDMATAVAEFRANGHPLKSLICNACGITDPYSVLDGTSEGIESISWFDSKVITTNFDKLHDLIYILLQNITEIDVEEENFHNFPKLKTLIITKANLPYLPERLFHNIKKLELIRLSALHLRQLNKDWFRNMENLDTLDLAVNQISYLYPDLLEDTFKLTNLQLRMNRITSIPQGFFRNLERLEVLDISNNPILSVDLDALFKHPQLWELHFHRIPCTTLTNKIEPYLKLVSANYTIQRCRNSANVDCLVLKRENLPDLQLLDYYGVPPQQMMVDIIEGIPCMTYCSNQLLERFYGPSNDPTNVKNTVAIMINTVDYLRKRKIFNIEGLAMQPLLRNINEQLDPIIDFYNKYY